MYLACNLFQSEVQGEDPMSLPAPPRIQFCHSPIGRRASQLASLSSVTYVPEEAF